MAKRFTDTNKYKKHFLRGLQGAYKVLWDFLYHDCDNSGIWIVDFEMAQHYVGKDLPVNREDAIKFFNSEEIRIIELDNGGKWFMPSFIEFQYGKLMATNKAHTNVIVTLKKYELIDNSLSLKIYDKGVSRGLQAPMDKDKDKDMDKERGMQVKKNGMTKNDFTLFQSKLIQEDLFIEPLMMGKGIKNKVDMLGWIKYFNLHIIGEDKTDKDYTEYRKHFKNWIVKFDTTKPPPVNGNSTNGMVAKQSANDMVKKYEK